MIKELDLHNFYKEIENGITLVEFGAKWCPPCRIQEPILEELSLEWGDNISIAKVDTDKESDLAAKYEVQGIPTLVIFKDGKKVDSLRGLHYIEQIKSKIEGVL
ncbi:thioredoxin family protein [Neobacillus citreus]|uniref:Thioredoxin n=1 Tax=Neobacillus citreus TaxID=2833578 RepID=A0A942T5C3_9BACI|nr:thioredoxin family protein [Neobacillus citreus]MCH6264797.1 thioredoxin family protein [Neobacillus citreus]